jgi:hypothetical protein
MGKEQRLPERLPGEYTGGFPNLKEHTVTSDETTTYNCVAFAAGDTAHWWEYLKNPPPGFYWPPEAVRDDDNGDIEALKRCFAAIGYGECGLDGSLEPGYTKVALYAIKEDDYKHAAIQRKSGEWSSKLGDGYDIRHKTPQCVAGPSYGKVMCYMKKRDAEAAHEGTGGAKTPEEKGRSEEQTPSHSA